MLDGRVSVAYQFQVAQPDIATSRGPSRVDEQRNALAEWSGQSDNLESGRGGAVCAVRCGMAPSRKRRFLEGEDGRQLSEVQMRAALCSGRL